MAERLLHFNGYDVDTAEYRRQPMPLDAFQNEIRLPTRPDPLTKRDVAAWVDPRNLAETGWGLVLHEDEQAEVIAALAPLVEHRRQRVGRRYQTFTYRASDRVNPQDFFDRYQIGHDDVDPDHLPYYLLIVGSSQQIPFEFQYELGITFAVGRLFFEHGASYATYARNVVQCETSRLARPTKMVLFGAENDALTRLSSAKLMVPLTEKLAGKAHGWELEAITGADATKQRLRQLMGGSQTPALLMTAGHAVYCSRDAARRVREQGSLITSDWPGLGSTLDREHYFGPNDVTAESDCRGTINFHFACFSAGTPEFDSWQPGKTHRLHDTSFVAPLPKRLLGHERGPLAIIGHVDQAFQYSFLWDDRIHEITHFASALYRLMKGYPVGAAMASFSRRFAVIGAEITRKILADGPSDELKLRYWMGYHDARNYLVLGDPAVSLPTA